MLVLVMVAAFINLDCGPGLRFPETNLAENFLSHLWYKWLLN
jgi:hypothetical protein